MTTATKRHCPYCGSGNITSLQRVRGWHCSNCEQSFTSQFLHESNTGELSAEPKSDTRWLIFVLPWFLIMTVAGIASMAFFNWQPALQTLPDGTEAEMRLTDELNKLRLDRGLQPLTSSADLTFIARQHAKDMADRDFSGSVTPEGVGPQERVDAAGLSYACAENVYVHDEGFSQAARYISKESTDSWKASEASMSNVYGDYTVIGSGVTWSRDTCGFPGMPCYSVYVTALFCKPTIS